MWETGSSLQERYNPKRVKLLSCSCVTCFARSVYRSFWFIPINKHLAFGRKESNLTKFHKQSAFLCCAKQDM